ncbi:hypothetical protein A6R68_19833 [Neotoma lepida]|uniref:Uncharacterized protein n=1 Tax=Neotoma lepida TaxID=56216 RepID=A0A1A6HHS1_NEOLE|nr:hypothetical protein A6R68_19833 [Neotoma lepida]
MALGQAARSIASTSIITAAGGPRMPPLSSASWLSPTLQPLSLCLQTMASACWRLRLPQVASSTP